MISIDFLKQPNSVKGLEFLDFQNNSFATELTQVINNYLRDGVLDDELADVLPSVIAKYTGFSNLKVKLENISNVGIDAGYLSPNNVLNNQGLDKFLSHTNTSLYRYFKENKENVFRASIDYKTGKVEGGFSLLPLTLYIEPNIKTVINEKYLNKYKVSLAESLASIIGHELGHAFGACMMMLSAATSNVMAQSAIRAYKEAKTEEERVLVVKDTGKLLEIKKQDQKEIERLAKEVDENSMLLYYSKLLNQRNANRALSLGVPTMTSEVIADAYSIRMGFTKGMLATVADLTKGGSISKLGSAFRQGMLVGWIFALIGYPLISLSLPVFGGVMIASIWITTVVVFFGFNYSDIYNSDPRRLDDALRTSIMKLKEDKNMSPTEKKELIQTLTLFREKVLEITPFYDNTIVDRLLGYIYHGKDFPKVNIEHFSQKLANHEINILSHRLQNV